MGFGSLRADVRSPALGETQGHWSDEDEGSTDHSCLRSMLYIQTVYRPRPRVGGRFAKILQRRDQLRYRIDFKRVF